MADIFADLLGQYLGSTEVVQPLLPSLFAPLLPLVADRTPWLTESPSLTPQETALFADERLEPWAEEEMVARTEIADDASQPGLAFAHRAVATSVLSTSVSALPFRHMLAGPRPLPVAAEPGPQAGVIPFGEPGNARSALPLPFPIPDQVVLANHAVQAIASEPSSLPAEGSRVLPQSQSYRPSSQESAQQSPLQGEKKTAQDRQVPHVPGQGRSLLPASESSVVSSSQPVVPLPVAQPVSLVQPRPQPASEPLIGRQEIEDAVTPEREHLSARLSEQAHRPIGISERERRSATLPEQTPQTATTPEWEQRSELAGQLPFQSVRAIIAPSSPVRSSDLVHSSQVAPLPGTQFSLRPVAPAMSGEPLPGRVPAVSESRLQIIAPAGPEDRVQMLPVSSRQADTPGVPRQAQVSFRPVSREQPEHERQTRQIFSQEQKSPLVSREPVAVQVFPVQERTVREDERESVPVRIHIGRVVVRGTLGTSHSAPTPPARRVIRPAQSLNEYLKQRERDSR